MIKTFSGHTKCPGQKGLRINSKIYSLIDKTYGPGSWNVTWEIKNSQVFANKIKVGDIDSPILEFGGTMRDVLFSDENIVASLGKPIWRGYELNYKTVRNTSLATYLKEMKITVSYIDNSEAHGWHGIKIQIDGKKKLYKHFSWPFGYEGNFRSIMDSIKKFVTPKDLELKLYLD